MFPGHAAIVCVWDRPSYLQIQKRPRVERTGAAQPPARSVPLGLLLGGIPRGCGIDPFNGNWFLASTSGGFPLTRGKP